MLLSPRPRIQNKKRSRRFETLFYSFFLQYEYKLDREFLKGCKLSVTDDKNTVLALNNAILASDVSA